MVKKALITGISGQDGAYLSKFLLEKNYEVYGLARRNSTDNLNRLDVLKIRNKVKIVDSDLLELSSIQNLIKEIKPQEIYNLAAQSFVPTSFSLPLLSTEINSLGCLRILDSIRNIDRDIRFYQASTSEMFGKVQEIPQSEKTKFYPRSPYGVSKLYSHYITINYRESYNIFACSGILFNHESPLRGNEFITKKISKALTLIKKDKLDCLYVGNIEAKRDWGFAGDYVEAMWKMLNAKKANDYVIATGITHSVKEFIDLASNYLDLDTEWRGEGKQIELIDKKKNSAIVKIDEKFYRPAEVDLLIGDPSLAKSELGWENKVSFENLVQMMVEYDMENN